MAPEVKGLLAFTAKASSFEQFIRQESLQNKRNREQDEYPQLGPLFLTFRFISLVEEVNINKALKASEPEL